MACRNAIAVVVTSLAILFSPAFSNSAKALPIYAPNDFITFRQIDWNSAPILTTPTPFATLYPSGLVVGTEGVPGQFFFLLLSGPDTLAFLPEAGTPQALTSNSVNPFFTEAGLFGGELVALTLNVDFSDAGLIGGTLGIPFGDLTLANFSGLPGLNGLSVRDFLSTAHTAIAGGSTGYTIADLELITRELNGSFLPFPGLFHGPSAFAEEHLRIAQNGGPDPGTVPEPNTLLLALLVLLGLAVLRRRVGHPQPLPT